MRLFKNRGDIYIPQTKFKSDREQKILFAALAFIVAFTLVFVTVFGIKYDFSAKNFFRPETINEAEYTETKNLPNVSGKSNFLFLLKNKDNSDVYICSLIQVDLDTLSYKCCSIDSKTLVGGESIEEIYKKGNAGNVVNALNELFGIEIDYFIDQNLKQYEDIFDYMGSINYTVAEDIRYKDNSYYGFNIKLKSGDQKIDGNHAAKVMRYYLSQGRYDLISDFMINALSQQINTENFEKREKIFSKFIDNCITNVTIRNYNDAVDALKVLSDETTGVSVYTASPIYEGNSIISSSIDDIRGYFVK